MLDNLNVHNKRIMEDLVTCNGNAESTSDENVAVLTLPLEVLRLVGLYRGEDTITEILESSLLLADDAETHSGALAYSANLLISYQSKFPNTARYVIVYADYVLVCPVNSPCNVFSFLLSYRALVERVVDHLEQYSPKQTRIIFTALQNLVLYQRYVARNM